jgi:hypothetical protein
MRFAVVGFDVRELIVQKLFCCTDPLLQYELFHCPLGCFVLIKVKQLILLWTAAYELRQNGQQS